MYFLINTTGKVRTVTESGKQWLVAPVTMIVEGVHSGNRGPIFYPRDQIVSNTSAWDHIPIVLNHPRNAQGEFISAATPGIKDAYGMGEVRNTFSTEGKLRSEAWFDPVKTRKVDIRVYNALKANKQIEVSAGLGADTEEMTTNSTFNGRSYRLVARNYRPDHLAVLMDGKGACSINDGCGILNHSTSRLLNGKYTETPPKHNTQTHDPQNHVPSGGNMKLSIWHRLGEVLGVGDTSNTSTSEITLVNALSFGDIEDQLKTQIKARFLPSRDSMSSMEYMPYCYIEDVFPDSVIYEIDGRMYKLPYSIEGSIATLSTEMPVEVYEVTTYEEVGNASTNSLANAVTKKEGEQTLSASSYAYTPDKASPSTWKLRIDDAAHVSGAVAALGPGFRGNKVQIPSGDLMKVKGRVRRAWRKFHPDKPMSEMPAVLRNETSVEDNSTTSIGNTANHGDTTMSLSIERRKQIVNSLLTNCTCGGGKTELPWKDKNEATLNSLSDDALSAYEGVLQYHIANSPNNRDEFTDAAGVRHIYNKTTNTWADIPPIPTQISPTLTNTQPVSGGMPSNLPTIPNTGNGVTQANIPVATPVVNSTTQPNRPLSVEEWLKMGPKDAQNIYNALMEEGRKQKEQLIGVLTANLAPETRDAAVQVYNTMELQALQIIASSIPVNQAPAQPVVNPVTNQWFPAPLVRPAAEQTPKPLKSPTYSFGKTG